jgi:hypothetical protein
LEELVDLLGVVVARIAAKKEHCFCFLLGTIHHSEILVKDRMMENEEVDGGLVWLLVG